MKKLILIVICLITISSVNAQKKAVTETGDEIILFDDGTWEYQDDVDLKKTEIPTNPIQFKKDDNSTFLLKSSKINLGFWLNPKIWSFKKGDENSESEYEIQLKDGDLYSMILTEKIEVPLETLKAIALENGREAAPDLKIVTEEYRMVNGIKVLHLQMNGTMLGIKFSYFGYYFSNSNGTVQFITYTSQNLIKEYKKECEKLLNGLVEIN